MTREELTDLARRNPADTLLARRLREALGLPALPHARAPRALDRTGESRKYRGARRLMAQRYGVKP